MSSQLIIETGVENQYAIVVFIFVSFLGKFVAVKDWN